MQRQTLFTVEIEGAKKNIFEANMTFTTTLILLQRLSKEIYTAAVTCHVPTGVIYITTFIH
jgi:hypothetical protein